MDVWPLMIPGRGFRSPCTLRQRSSSSGHLYAMEGYPNRIAVFRTKRGEGRTDGKTLRVFHGHNENIKNGERESTRFLLRPFFCFPGCKASVRRRFAAVPVCRQSFLFQGGYEEAACGAIRFPFQAASARCLVFLIAVSDTGSRDAVPGGVEGRSPPRSPQAASARCLVFAIAVSDTGSGDNPLSSTGKLFAVQNCVFRGRGPGMLSLAGWRGGAPHRSSSGTGEKTSLQSIAYGWLFFLGWKYDILKKRGRGA